ncbi:MAG: PmoA family protein [Anaerohalosphaera sp.]|nr:PmoA family protein [Anaerohalosphaera sp.]
MNKGDKKGFFKRFSFDLLIIIAAVMTLAIILHVNSEKKYDKLFLDIQNRIEMLPKRNISKKPVRFQESGSEIEVYIGDSLVGRYLWGDDLPKPILYDVMTLSGSRVTRGLLSEKIKGETTEHPHHTGMFFTYGRVNGENFWANTTTPPQIKQVSLQTNIDVQGEGHISVVLHWISTEGKVLLVEKREMSFFPLEDGFVIDLSIDLSSQSGKVVFYDTKEGMFAIRMADWLAENGGTGRYFSSNGDQTEKHVWGKRAEWVCLEGKRENKRVGVAIINQADSVNYPAYWHTRAYGLFAVNPFGQFDYETTRGISGVKQLNYTLESDQSAHFGFRVYVYEATRL